MKTLQDLQKAAHLFYPRMLSAWLTNQLDSLLPHSIPAGAPPDNTSDIPRLIDVLKRSAKNERQAGYRIEYITIRTQRHGSQTLPQKFIFDTIEDVVEITKKRTEFDHFCTDIALIRDQLPQLESWLPNHIPLIIKHHGIWSNIVQVCRYWLDHPSDTAQFSREIALPLPTKFIERHETLLRKIYEALGGNLTLLSDEPIVRIRFLGGQFAKMTGLNLDDMTLPLSQAARLEFHHQTILVIENKTTFLTVPAKGNWITLWGSGYDVERLSELNWLKNCHILYWGDLDAHGFEILNRARHYLPDIKSILMDKQTFEAHSSWVIAGTPAPIKELSLLTQIERDLYQYLARTNQRLEQERIGRDWVLNHLFL